MRCMGVLLLRSWDQVLATAKSCSDLYFPFNLRLFSLGVVVGILMTAVREDFVFIRIDFWRSRKCQNAQWSSSAEMLECLSLSVSRIELTRRLGIDVRQHYQDGV